MFPNGERGWHGSIHRIKPNERNSQAYMNGMSSTRSVSNYATFGELLHRENRGAETYDDIDVLDEEDHTSTQSGGSKERLGDKIGTRIYVTSTFIGGPRDMKQRYLDSMCLVQEFGRPDIFLTMICNPKWPEIKELLEPGELLHNCPDLLARVFKAKLSILNDKIMSGEIFGKPASVVHVIEFQKRGLPHAHFLIILNPGFNYHTPEAYDRIVSAELPDKHRHPYLYSLVVRHMMHGPCGEMNDQNICMRNGLCKNHYPKDFADHTTWNWKLPDLPKERQW